MRMETAGEKPESGRESGKQMLERNPVMGSKGQSVNSLGVFETTDPDRRKEQEDMKSKYYHVDGAMVVSVDTGYGNTKTAHRVFRSSVQASDNPPVFSKDYIEYRGKYYIVGEGHKSFIADKVTDDDNYILMLAAVAKELECRGMDRAKIYLAVGLPLKWVSVQKESFRKYMLRDRHVEYRYKDRPVSVEIVGCAVMPQCYSAVAMSLKDFKGMNLLADLGNGTLNIMYLNDGKASESQSWTEQFGVNQCVIRICNEVRDATGYDMPAEMVEQYLRKGTADISENYERIMHDVAVRYVKEVFDKLRDYKYNPDIMQLHFMGGGAKIVQRFGEYDKERTHFITDICATAKGYEYYCYIAMKRKNEAEKRRR